MSHLAQERTYGLAIVWAFVASTFFFNRYATINWAAVYVAPAFLAQALLFGFLATGRGVGPIGFHSSIAGRIALGVFVFSLVGYPLTAVLVGRPLAAAEFFAIAPDPTVVATLAILSTARSAVVLLASVVPLLWAVVTALTLWTLGSLDFGIATLSALLCGAAWLIGRTNPSR